MSSLLLDEIGLNRAMAKAVGRKARAAGKSAPEYVRCLIERDLLAGKSFDEILKPIRADIHRNGVSPAQVDRIVTRARAAARRRNGGARR